MICPRCKGNVMDGSTSCVKCGYNFSMNSNQNNMVNNNQMMNNNFNNNLNSNVSYGNNNSNDVFKEKKSGNKAIIIVIVVLLVGVVGFFGYKFFTGRSSGELDINNKDDDSSYNSADLLFNPKKYAYAIFDYKGKKITDFIFSTNEKGFNFGAAVVNDGSGHFLVDTKGKKITKPGEYSRYVLYNVLYDTKSINSKDSDINYYLSTKGKRLFSQDEYKIVTPGDMEGEFAIVKNLKNNDISYVNVDGDILITIPSNGVTADPEFDYSPDYSDYLSIYYGNKNYIIDFKNNKVVLNGFASSNQYCAASYNDNTKLLVTYLCNTYDEDGKKFFYAFKNNKEVNSNEFENKCFKSKSYVKAKENKVLCGEYIFDDNLKYIDNTNNYNYIIDFNNYIKDGDVYKDGKKVKSLSCLKVMSDDKFSKDGFYHLKSLDNSRCNGDGLISLYDSSGNKLENSYYYLYDFDENGLAYAGNKDRNYFLINKKSEKISDNYQGFNRNGKYYVVTLNDKKGIVDTNGKLVVPCEYDEIEIYYRFDRTFAELIIRGDKHLVKNLTENKDIYEGKGYIRFKDVHLHINDSDTGLNSYYSYYTGKKFYEFNVNS